MRLLSHQAQSNDLQGEQRHRATWSSEQCEVIMLAALILKLFLDVSLW